MKSPAEPRYRQISKMLRIRIESGKLPKHTLLPSQNELAREFDVTPMTVLRALDELIRDGVIYRKQGAGTFVAPRRNRSPILLVPPADDNSSLVIRTEFAEFFLGALEAANSGNLAYQPEIIGREELIAQLPDLRLIYPRLGGIIFMREFQRLEPLLDTFAAAGIPIFYYGRNVKEAYRDGFSCLFHNEDEIARMTAHYLASRDLIRVGRVLNMPTADYRSDRLLEIGPTYGLELRPEDRFECYHYPEHLDGVELLARRCDVLDCFTDDLAWKVIRHLTRAGVNVPGDVAVIGVNDAPIASQALPAITTIEINNMENGKTAFQLFVEQLEKDLPFRKINCPLKLHVRESC